VAFPIKAPYVDVLSGLVVSFTQSEIPLKAKLEFIVDGIQQA